MQIFTYLSASEVPTLRSSPNLPTLQPKPLR